MSVELSAEAYPELFIGLAGPLGIDIDALTDSLERALRAVGYSTLLVKVTDEMMEHACAVPKPVGSDFYSSAMFKIRYANQLCEDRNDPSTLMRIVLDRIAKLRLQECTEEPAFFPKRAFIIRQLKRPDEVRLLRKVYGRQFILVSAYGSKERRLQILKRKLTRSLPVESDEADLNCKAMELILTDEHEEQESGQHLRDTFHLADVFVDGIHRAEMDNKVTRFVQAFFGRTDISPSKDEYGMYAAKSASLRSSDLSRQVGAAVFTPDGELITQGCNEVPKAFGGTYWDLEQPDHRDVKLGDDPNDVQKAELLRDIIERLGKKNLLSSTAVSFGSPTEIVNALTTKPSGDDAAEKAERGYGCLYGSTVTNLTEFGRVVHAEMCAICDAARLGRSLRGSTLFCTTFPCHNCTKHILAAGIRRVVYMEPYPKSKAKELHENEIEIEEESADKVAFVPFLGVSPFRYRDIFEKRKRKKGSRAIEWYQEAPRPMVEVSAPNYPQSEILEAARLYGETTSSDGPHST